MKNIAKILKQALRKSATNILEDKETLLTEQPAHGYLMILKTCSHQTDGTPNTQGWNCTLYDKASVKDISTNQFLQVGECFAWMFHTGTYNYCGSQCPLTCIAGITNIPAPMSIERHVHACDDCQLDTDNDGIPDCVDCPQVSGVTYGCMDSNIVAPIIGSTPNCNPYDPVTLTGCNLYDAAVNIDDGTCCSTGCTDPAAPNYDPTACIDDNTCVPETFDCVNEFCEVNIQGNGNYSTLNDCLESQECNRWECKEDYGPDPHQTGYILVDRECKPCKTSSYDVITSIWEDKCQFKTEIECEDKGCKKDCENNPELGCWTCHAQVGSQNPMQTSCWQPPQSWINIHSYVNFYNIQQDCLNNWQDCATSHGNVCLAPDGSPCLYGGVCGCTGGEVWYPYPDCNCGLPSSPPPRGDGDIEPTADELPMDLPVIPEPKGEPLREGLQLKGKLLNSKRMKKLANIK